MLNQEFKRGDIWKLQIGDKKIPGIQGGLRPAVIVSNDIGNRLSCVMTIVPISSSCNRKMKNYLPVHVKLLSSPENGLERNSVAMAEQIRVVAKEKAVCKMGKVSKSELRLIEEAIKISLALTT